jgi:hypothetical protein
MSDGGIGTQGAGTTFWATINIKGDLTQVELKGVMTELKTILKNKKVDSGGTVGSSGKPINGLVVQAVRTSAGKSVDLGPPITIGLKNSPP